MKKWKMIRLLIFSKTFRWYLKETVKFAFSKIDERGKGSADALLFEAWYSDVFDKSRDGRISDAMWLGRAK